MYLDKAGIEIIDGMEDLVSICEACIASLKRNHRPKFSVVNDLDFGTPFAYLPDPSIAEECLFAGIRARCYILKLTSHAVGPPATQQRAIKGHVICFHQNVKQIVTSLPHSTEDLVDIIQVAFLGSNTTQAVILEQLKKCKLLQVRQHVVRAWLKMLVEYHPGYKVMQINEG